MSWNPNANSWDPRQQHFPSQQQQQPQYPQPNPYGQPQGYGQPPPQQQFHGMMPGRGAPMYGGVPPPQQPYYGQPVQHPHPGYAPRGGGGRGHAVHDPRYNPPPQRGGYGGGGYVVDPNAYGGREQYVPPQPRYDDGYHGGHAAQYQNDGYGDNWDDDTPIEAMAAMRLDKESEAQRVQQAAEDQQQQTSQKSKRKRKRGKKKKNAEEAGTVPPTSGDANGNTKSNPPPIIRVAAPSKKQPSPEEEATSTSTTTPQQQIEAEPETSATVDESPSAGQSPVSEEIDEKKEDAPPPPASKKKKKGKKNKVTWDRHDEREHVNLVLIGHVDAGKSTLSGQILLQLNKIDERTIAKYEREAKERNRESWWIAYIMDEDDEERAKGKTVECGRAHFDTPAKRYTILDAPGHKNYVPNMISGAAQADIAVLVISARMGEFEAGFERGGQTQEHAQLAFTLGISRLVIVVNKMDTCDYSQERYETIISSTTSFLRECGFKEKYMDYLPIAGQTGGNVIHPFEEGLCPWWTGKTLIQTLDSLKKIKRLTSSPLRVTVLDRYKGDKGLTVIGKVEAGVLSVGQPIVAMPSGSSAVVGTLSIDDEVVESAGAGENVLVTFTSSGNLNDSRVYGGSILSAVAPDTVPVGTRLKTEIYVIDSPEAGIMAVGFRAMFHCHNVATECEIAALPHLINRKLGKVSRRPPAFLKVKNSAVAELQLLGAPAAIEPFDVCAPLGRFTLRDQGKTVVIGMIKEVLE